MRRVFILVQIGTRSLRWALPFALVVGISSIVAYGLNASLVSAAVAQTAVADVGRGDLAVARILYVGLNSQVPAEGPAQNGR
jgi:hypothetical protein